MEKSTQIAIHFVIYDARKVHKNFPGFFQAFYGRFAHSFPQGEENSFAREFVL